MVGLKEVYKIDPLTGSVLGLEDISSRMAPAIPRCPHCQRPIRQYATQRYNRLINRAVIDEMSKRFIVTGQTELQGIEEKLRTVESELEDTRSDIVKAKRRPRLVEDWLPGDWLAKDDQVSKGNSQQLQTRYKPIECVRSAVSQLRQRTAKCQQPAHKLHEATVHAMRRLAPLESNMATVKLTDFGPTGECDHRITLGAKMMEIKIDFIAMQDKFRILSAVKADGERSAASITFPGGSPLKCAGVLLKSCADFVADCTEKALPKLAVEASLYHAQVSRLFTASGISEPADHKKAVKYVEEARRFLEDAEKLCQQGFHNADALLQAVTEALKLLQKERYEEVTAEELEDIKRAMISGRGGIATHSGHWYNCANGHPVGSGSSSSSTC